jgi:CBS domain-containing protein
MKEISVQDLMVPLDEYVTVSVKATMFDAVMALEKAHEELDRKRYTYLHRAILVYDENKKIVGKISQLDVLRALEPKYMDMGDQGVLSRAGFSPQFLKSMLERYSLFDMPLRDMCSKAAKVPVTDFMYTPTEGEYIDETASLGEAVHQLVMGRHQSLLVTKEKDIVGILRLTDVFKYIFQTMKTGEISQEG